MINEFAPAKINLSLHLVGQKSDGYHLLDSIVSFVNVGDTLRMTPGRSSGLIVEGPFAKDLPSSSHNLVFKAAEIFSNVRLPQIMLEKNIPVASGIGGGSADDYWFGISPEGFGSVAMVVNFVISYIVMKFTSPTPEKIKKIVDNIRIPEHE